MANDFLDPTRTYFLHKSKDHTQNQKSDARKKATKKLPRVPFLEIQVLRLEGRPFRRSLYEQLPLEPIFQWVEGREVSGWRSQLPYDLDSWLYAEPDLEDWARPSRYQLVGVQPRKISMVLPTQLRKSLEAEIRDWKSPNAALRATTRTVNENLKRLKQLETTLMENDERWFQAYREMETLPQIFI